MRIILIFSVVMFFYFLQRKIYINRCFKKVNADVKFESTEVFQGEYLNLRLTLTNKKIMPLWWLGVKYVLSRNIVFSEDEEDGIGNDNYRRDVFFMMPYERITKDYTVKASKRGYYLINGIELNSGDLFGDRRLLKKLKNNTELFVYPRLISTDDLNIVFQRINGELITRRNLLEDPFQLRGIREYTPFDSMKAINWKATARSSDLKVNQFESTCSGGVTLILNVEKFNSFDSEDLVEEAVSIAASLATRYINQGISVEVISNGCDCIEGLPVRVREASTFNKNIEIYEALAQLDISRMERHLSDLINEEVSAGRKEKIIVVISHFYGKEAVECYKTKVMEGFNMKWIVPIKDNRDVPPADIEELYCWEVQPQ
ncbi:MAG: DUF58 domain-containing protein [Bacillota bacterium]|nr:DUF58 domain-containing protein [Bacillota bacterium]